MRGCVNCEYNDQLNINDNDFIEDVASFYERLTRRGQYPDCFDPSLFVRGCDYYPRRDKHPENNEHKALTTKPQTWSGAPEAAITGGRKHLCCGQEWGRVAEAGETSEDICQESRSCPWAGVSRHPQHIYSEGGPGPGGEVMKIKPLKCS